MAQDDGALEDKVADAAALPVVDVGAADAGLLDLDAHVVFVAQLWDLAALERDVFDGLEDKRWVLGGLRQGHLLEIEVHCSWTHYFSHFCCICDTVMAVHSRVFYNIRLFARCFVRT